jgi:hypothetical protein
MRKFDLDVLNGCEDPDKCDCTFRHKRCRIFMIGKESNQPNMEFFSTSCKGINMIQQSNDKSQIHGFIQLFHTTFSNRVLDLVNYVNYIIDPNRENTYAITIAMIADPYIKSQNVSTYGKPLDKNNNIKNNKNEDENEFTIIDDIDVNDFNIEFIENNKPDNTTDNLESINLFESYYPGIENTILEKQTINTKNTTCSGCGSDDIKSCSLNWHQDYFSETTQDIIEKYRYDYVAMFVLNSRDVSEHKLQIGKLRTDIDIKGMTNEEIQSHIVPVSETVINDDNSCDIGYIINQSDKNFYHKHSSFDHLSNDSRRNVIIIRFKMF